MHRVRPFGCPNVFTDGESIFTRSLSKGPPVYGERIVRQEGEEFRRWEPRRSKMAAYIKLSGRCGGLKRDDTVIYLGAATGTTVSHISDIVDEGTVYAVELSKRAFRELLVRCSRRGNVVPVMGDARDPLLLSGMLARADYLYVDVAQRDQVSIFLGCFKRHMCRHGMLMLKCRSVDVSASPASVARRSADAISSEGLKVVESVNLAAYEKDHYAMLIEGGRRCGSSMP